MTVHDGPAAVDRERTPRRVAIRWKLGAAMLVPVLILAAVVTLQSYRVTRDADRARGQAALAVAADGPGGLLKALQDERNWAAVELIGQAGGVQVDVEGYDETRRNTDAAIAGFEDQVAASDERARAFYARALERLDGLADLRARIDAFDAPRTIANGDFGDEIFDGYTEMIVPFLDAVELIADEVDDRQLRQGALLIAVSSAQVEVVANLVRRTLVWSLFTEGGVDTREEVFEITRLAQRLKNNEALLEVQTTGPYASEWDEDLFRVFTWKLVVHSGEAVIHGTVDVEAFLEVVTVPTEESYLGYRQRIGRIVQSQAEDLADEAAARQRLYLGLLGATAALTALAVVAITRSIVRPLRSLARQTDAVAHHHLPEALSAVLRTPLDEDIEVPPRHPIAAPHHGEIGELAGVLDRVQGSAVDLAVEQAILRRNLADVLVHLGRRNQELLHRQLGLITDLERDETDPAVLTNLFQLDHLATRMRRNAESLLVLGGLPPARTRTDPVDVPQVVRAALGEVEDYRRVRLALQPGVVTGTLAGDLAHLLAELVENALMYSPPDEPVDVHGTRTVDGYRITVSDRGLGMAPEELAAANRRLAGAESFTVAPSKYLGHYVSGHLARRHGARVRVDPAPTGGIVATVDLPAAALVPGEASRQPLTTG
ncbi:MAG TPA: nitrate- and nitrite sensing domain-containing protein [Acidimicrobiales bacterium]